MQMFFFGRLSRRCRSSPFSEEPPCTAVMFQTDPFVSAGPVERELFAAAGGLGGQFCISRDIFLPAHGCACGSCLEDRSVRNSVRGMWLPVAGIFPPEMA